MRRGPPLFDAFLDGREPVSLVVAGEVVVVVAQEAAVDDDGVDQWDHGEESDETCKWDGFRGGEGGSR